MKVYISFHTKPEWRFGFKERLCRFVCYVEDNATLRAAPVIIIIMSCDKLNYRKLFTFFPDCSIFQFCKGVFDEELSFRIHGAGTQKPPCRC